jgi:hypothetical protein
MKFAFLTLLFLGFVATIHSQNMRTQKFGDNRTETYTYFRGGDSLQYTIAGKNDTLKVTEFYRNGNIETVSWKNDSVYRFDALGRIVSQSTVPKNDYYGNGKTTFFYSNGSVKVAKLRTDDYYSFQSFFKNGHLFFKEESIRTPLGFFVTIKDSNGIKIRSSGSDTFLMKVNEHLKRDYDTIFYANGAIYKIEIKCDGKNLDTRYYDIRGNLTKTELPDSLKISVFKDNIDCFYGLKNERGDTIVPPRFDKITDQDPHFFVATMGEKMVLFDHKGASTKPFSNNLTYFYKMEDNYDEARRSVGEDDYANRAWLIDTFPKFYFYKEGDNYGVMDAQLNIVLPPQYFTVKGSYKHGELFKYEEYEKNLSLSNYGFINRLGKLVFDKKYKGVSYSNCRNYFFLSSGKLPKNEIGYYNRYEKGGKKNMNYMNIVGLGSSDGTVLIEPNFSALANIHGTALWIASKIKFDSVTKTNSIHEGIFNADTRKWLLDTSGFCINRSPSFFLIQSYAAKKWGMMDTLGKLIVPFEYDSIITIDGQKGLFLLEKDHKHSIFEVKDGKAKFRKTTYNHLSYTSLPVEHKGDLTDYVYFFIAQKDKKWGVIDADEKVLKPFEYDYATRMGTNYSEFGLVKNNVLTQYDACSFPNESDGFYRLQILNDFDLVGSENRSFFVNEDGKVVIPPQYEIINRVSNERYRLAQATTTQKKIIFLETGRIINFPFTYKIEYINEKSKIIVVRDYARTRNEGYKVGVVSTNGKVLAPCVNYNVAVGDEDAGVFFVKKDNIVPKSDDEDFQIVNSVDTLNREDKDWMMYGLDGQLLNKTPFRFPIDFNDGIGAGMQGDKFNLYRNDGTVLKPFLDVKKTPQNAQNMERSDIPNTFGTEGVLLDFNNIRRDPRNGFYALFYNQGLTPTAILTDKNGETLVNSGHYDGFSQFFGKYALVSANGMVGLIDTLGREIIAPQDMRNFKGNLMDSLELFNKKIEQDQLDDKNTDRFIDMPLKLYDSLSIIMPEKFKKDATYSAVLWNLILEKHHSVMIFKANDVKIIRLRKQIDNEFSRTFMRSLLDSDDNYWYVENVEIAKNTIAFTSKKMNSSSNTTIFHNFYRRNDRWEDIKIQEILNLQGENRWKMNDLIIKKVKALEKADIDCSNPEAFVTRVENNFLLTPEGIEFYFISGGYNDPLEKIFITWAELKPFLRIKME